MIPSLRLVLFTLFFVSGFCGLLYQVVWVRLAFASFGIITPVLSLVISIFMLGLAIGSSLGGKLVGCLTRKTGVSAIVFYGITEFMIGLGAFVVPKLFLLGEQFLLRSGESNSGSYLLLSAVMIAIALLPWCVCMGTTFPFMMAFVKERDRTNTKSFSFLYLANCIGATCGVLLTAIVLVELLGFRHTLWVAAASNFVVAAISFVLGARAGQPAWSEEQAAPARAATSSPHNALLVYMVLFTSGFASMAMEVVWLRAFTPVLKTQVYSFALVLFVYLAATSIGSRAYRRSLVRNSALSPAQLFACLAVFAFLPIVLNDPRLFFSEENDPMTIPRACVILASIFPFCATLGYLTPLLIDDQLQGNPSGAGKAYALNITGCIFGPLFASYLLLPWVGAKTSMVILGAPFLIFFGIGSRSLARRVRLVAGAVAGLCVIISLFFNASYEDDPARYFQPAVVRRDYAATVISGGQGMSKRLFVNGIGITYLTPITKYMSHLPLAFHHGSPKSALVICFGMGTSFRSALSWNIPVTAVELTPSVKDAFGFYFSDAPTLLKRPDSRIVIDDGRRFLKRTDESFDVITIDPPPPVEAAGSSLLYSEEFYTEVKRRLKPNGILQQWLPASEEKIERAVARSIANSFPYVRVYRSVEGWGDHFLASMSPIDSLTFEEFIARLPESARRDFMEWSEDKNLRGRVGFMLSREFPIATLLSPDPRIHITDDWPLNEYFLLRRVTSGHFLPY